MAIVRVVRVLCTKNHLVLAAPFDDGRDEFWVEETKNRVQALINKKLYLTTAVSAAVEKQNGTTRLLPVSSQTSKRLSEQ